MAPGQRVAAPVQGRPRTGVVVALREGDAAGLLPVARPLEPAPVWSRLGLEVARWAAGQSLCSWGSTLAALAPPLAGGPAPAAPPPEAAAAGPASVEVWTGPDRRERLAEAVLASPGPSLLIAPDVETAAAWARRLEAARLDSGAPPAERRAAWLGAARGRHRVVVGTRGALLAPLPPPATLVLLDEHEAAHKPPGAPRLHSREILAERARREGSRLLLLSATPSVETWWRAAERRWALRGIARPAWPEVLTADTRGILRHHPLTLPLTRALTEVPRRGRPVALVVSREASALGCEECASVLRCGGCGVALAFSRQPAGLACRLCGRQEAPPEACPACRGRRLGPVGWSAERVEAAVRRRFPALSVARWRRGPAPQAQVLIGTPALLRALPPGGASAVGFVALDAFLRVPDFRGAERALAHLWTAAEATGPRGRVVVQTLHPDHYAVRAAVTGDRSAFYDPELAFRQELGYPPFRRLAAVSVTGGREAVVRELAQECARSLTGVAGLTVYPPAPRGPGGARRSRWRFVVKGPDDLPALLAGPLAPRLQRRRERGAVVEVEMDPLALG